MSHRYNQQPLTSGVNPSGEDGLSMDSPGGRAIRAIKKATKKVVSNVTDSIGSAMASPVTGAYQNIGENLDKQRAAVVDSRAKQDAYNRYDQEQAKKKIVTGQVKKSRGLTPQ